MFAICLQKNELFVKSKAAQLNTVPTDEIAKLLETKKVAVVPGTAFGDCGEGFLRISYAYSLENLKTALDRIEEFVKEL